MIIHGITNSDVARVQPSDAIVETTKQDGADSRGVELVRRRAHAKTVTNASESRSCRLTKKSMRSHQARVSDDSARHDDLGEGSRDLDEAFVGSIRNKLIDAFQELWRTSV